MSTLSSTIPDQTREAARDLLAQRSQLETWLARLDDQAAEVPAHIAERVRNDYTQRLADVTGRLTEHRDAIRESLAGLRAHLATAEEQYRTANDEREEVRLRHLLGELPDAEWEQRRGRLDKAVSGAEQDRDAARGEVEGLANLMAEIDAPVLAGETTPPADASSAAPAAAPVSPPSTAPAEVVAESGGGEAETAAPPPAAVEENDEEQEEDELPILHPQAAQPEPEPQAENGDEVNFDAMFAQWGDEPPPTPATPAPSATPPAPTPEAAEEEGVDDLAFLRDLGVGEPPAAPQPRSNAVPADSTGGEEDFAFLEELDRAIAASAQPAPGKPAGSGGGGGMPAVGEVDLLCKACGAINDPRAWYCEVCGADLT